MKNFTKINNEYYKDNVISTRDIIFIDEFRNDNNPHIVNRVDWYLSNLFGKTDDCLFEKDDIPKLYERFSDNYKKGEFELYLHALIIQRGWYNKFKHGFMVYENPQKTER